MTGVSAGIRLGEAPGRRESARALRAVRTIRRARGEGASRGDIVYAVYAAAMVGAIVAFPLVRAVVLWLAEPQASGVLIEVGPAVAASVFAFACAGFVALGGVRGPAALSPFLIYAVAGSGHPRRRTLLRPVLRAVLVLAVLGAALTLLPAMVLVAGGGSTVGGALAFTAAGALAGVVCGACWVLGQSASGAVRAWIVAGVLAAWGVWAVAAFAVPPLGFVLVVLGVLAAAGVAVIPGLLDRMRGPALLAQAQRWQTAGTLAFTGDLAMAMGEFRAVPRRGRGLAAIGDFRSLVLLFLRRDLVGSLRTPGRFASACAGCLGFGLLVAVATGASGVGMWFVACAAAVVGHLALGVWSDGFRHVAEVAAAPPLYGVSTGRLLGLHAGLPVVGGVVWAVLGAGAGSVLGFGFDGGSVGGFDSGFGGGVAAVVAAVLASVAVAVVSVLLLVLVRVYDSAKGPLPLTLMAPVPTPVGDMSALVVAAWQADAVLLAGFVVGAVVAAVGAFGVAGVFVGVPLGAGLVWMARRRVLA
ncbi:hypothetical protein [Agreia sp. COWG]|uniref:hypothetical protein n=1 Tax=Agreia sp. COWG TaxID=2773266 RepID=UPI001925D94A|nr:hypothetical protein [Agreia sp. COWG]CAD6008505.1 conserved membrane protein of unknown function [Agreia sp. COWG]